MNDTMDMTNNEEVVATEENAGEGEGDMADEGAAATEEAGE